jgi:hypothetical protein
MSSMTFAAQTDVNITLESISSMNNPSFIKYALVDDLYDVDRLSLACSL